MKNSQPTIKPDALITVAKFALGDPRVEDSKELRSAVYNAMRGIGEKESLAVFLRATGLTLKFIALIMGLTRERVRQLEAKGIRRLRHPSRLKLIEQYVKYND